MTSNRQRPTAETRHHGKTETGPGPLVSIVVPVFNTATTLERCIDSLTRQTYPHLEILLVNDGSTDGSALLCRELAQKDARLRVIDQSNGGLSAARNTGIANSHGEFIACIDSDDYVDDDFIGTLVSAITSNPGIDLAIGGFVTDNPAFAGKEAPSSRQILAGRDYLRRVLQDPRPYAIVAWSKLYRARLLRTRPFPVGKVHEDEFTYYRYISDARKIITVPAASYHYVYNRAGITSTEDLRGVLDKAEAYLQRIRYQRQEGFSAESVDLAVRSLLVLLIHAKQEHPDISFRTFRTDIHTRLGRSLGTELRESRDCLSRPTAALASLFAVSPFLASAAYRLWKKTAA